MANVDDDDISYAIPYAFHLQRGAFIRVETFVRDGSCHKNYIIFSLIFSSNADWSDVLHQTFEGRTIVFLLDKPLGVWISEALTDINVMHVGAGRQLLRVTIAA